MIASPDLVPRKLQVKKASQLLAEELKAQIVRGELKPGDALPSEAVLTERYGVSRPTFREAIRILETEDLVRTTRGGRGGARVRHPSAERAAGYAGMVLQLKGATIRDMLRMRSALLPPAAALAAQHAATSDLAPLNERLAQLAFDPNDLRGGFVRVHALELAIIDLSRSETMKLISQMLTLITAQQLWEVPATVEELPDFVVSAVPHAREHNVQLVERIRAGDAEGASLAARERMASEERLWDRRVAYLAPVRVVL